MKGAAACAAALLLLLGVRSARGSLTHSRQPAGAATAACNASAYTISLNHTQCFGLFSVDGPATYGACLDACCGTQMFQFCPAGTACGTYAGPSCWCGAANLSACARSPAINWQGASLPAPPPPPPPLVQRFSAPSRATAPLAALDLADERPTGGAWTLAVDGGPPRAIGVPAGGYSSDVQAQPWLAQADVRASVVYARALTAPARPPLTVLRLAFGAVNHGARVRLNGAEVGAHLGPMMPFEIDVTAAVDAAGGAGAPLNLTVEVFPYAALRGLVPSGFLYAEAWQNNSGGWASRACAGLCRSVRLLTLPAVRVEAVALRASVGPPAALALRFALVNDGAAAVPPGALTLAPALSSFTHGAAPPPWAYPALPLLTLAQGLPPGGRGELALGVDWSALGPASWWWPNRPYSAAYAAELHWLNASLRVAGGGASASATRFGFVEHGAARYFYTLNGLRVNHLSDATPENGVSYYDAYSAPASYLASSPGGAWRRYMAVGMTSNRIHQSTPTEAMLDAADEVGFLLKPESPVRGACTYEPCPAGVPSGATVAGFAQAVAELAGACRGHPSVFSYSVENESPQALGGVELIGALIDAAAGADASVPLTTEGSGDGAGFNGTSSGASAVNLLHYALPDDSRAHIRGVGECAWCVEDGLEAFAAEAAAGRLADFAYTAGWDWLNFWSNFFPGFSAARHAWQQPGCAGRDRTDGIDGWGSPVIDWVQRAFHAFAPMDLAAYAAAPRYVPGWPGAAGAGAALAPGAPINRSVAVFNDVLRGDLAPWGAGARARVLAWSAHWDAPGSAPVLRGQVAVDVAPGFHAVVSVALAAPAPPPVQAGSASSASGASAPPRRLYLVLANGAAGAGGGEDPEAGVEDRVYVLVQGAAAGA
jgi:hypothetical protein